MSNTKVRFSVPAEHDLQSIRRYTLSSWGSHQWIKTKARLDRAFDHLSLFPDSGRIGSLSGDPARALFRGPFVIFYDHDALGVLILRVMSQKQHAAHQNHHEEWAGEEDLDL
jgi:plasmid stabilization system protein ParE